MATAVWFSDCSSISRYQRTMNYCFVSNIVCMIDSLYNLLRWWDQNTRPPGLLSAVTKLTTWTASDNLTSVYGTISKRQLTAFPLDALRSVQAWLRDKELTWSPYTRCLEATVADKQKPTRCKGFISGGRTRKQHHVQLNDKTQVLAPTDREKEK